MLVRLPLLENFDVNLRLADYCSGRTRLTNAVIAVSASTAWRDSKNSSSLLLGVGAAYTFYGHWSAKLDYTRVIDQAGNSNSKVVGMTSTMLSVGVELAAFDRPISLHADHSRVEPLIPPAAIIRACEMILTNLSLAL